MVHFSRSSRNIFLGMGGGAISSQLYAKFSLSLWLFFTETLMNMLLRSREVTRPVAETDLNLSRSSSVELMQ